MSIKPYLFALAATLLSAQVSAETITHGGDPRAAEAINMGEAACKWMRAYVKYAKHADACDAEVKDLADSLNNFNRRPRITFQSEEVKDSYGTPKDLTTDPVAKTLLGNIDRWQNSTTSQKVMTMAMELCILLGVPGRYDVAKDYGEWTATPPAIKVPRSVLGSEFGDAEKIVFRDQVLIEGNPRKAFVAVGLENDEFLNLRCSERPPSVMSWDLYGYIDGTRVRLKSGTETYAEDLGCKKSVAKVYANLKATNSGIQFQLLPDDHLKITYGRSTITPPENMHDYYWEREAARPANEGFPIEIGSGEGAPNFKICKGEKVSNSKTRLGGNNSYEVSLLAGASRRWFSANTMGLSCESSLPFFFTYEQEPELGAKRWYSFPSQASCEKAREYILLKWESDECAEISIREEVPNPSVQWIR